MATHVPADRHTTARNTILFWLGAAILVACILVLVTYHMLRNETDSVPLSASVLSKRDSTAPAIVAPRAQAGSDSSADIARAHQLAVAAASGETTTTESEPSKPE